jgi:hypothetical protein
MMEKKRQYVRVSTVFPVEFFVLDKEGNRITPWLQGFTRDIGKGGVRLTINDLWWGFWDKFNWRDAQLFVKIDLPFGRKVISTKAKVAWLDVKKHKEYNRYSAGVEFVGMGVKEAKSLFKYAIFKKYTPLGMGILMAILCLFAVQFFWKAESLVKENRRIVKDYVSLIEKSSDLEKMLEEGEEVSSFFQDRQKDLKGKIKSLEEQVSQWQEKYKDLMREEQVEEEEQKEKAQQEQEEQEEWEEYYVTVIASLNKEIEGLEKENEFLQVKQKEKELANLAVRKQAQQLEQERNKSLGKIIDGMYAWITNRQDLEKGLVLSYEGDQDLNEVYFTYDQSLAAISFMLFNDLPRAEKILDFYLEKVRRGESIYNAYCEKGDVFEYTTHSGPNAWLGIAALNYMKQTGNRKYRPIADKVSKFLMRLADEEGGIKGGPIDEWYSTEHNLDAFAFFDLFYQVTGKEKYLETAEKIKGWISKYAYTDYGPPVKRGKGDATIATDTYAWSVTAFGPGLLSALRMNSNSILDFAVENCEVSVRFKRNGDEVDIVGFDFAKNRNVARGGVVSGEWTSQMILAFEVMADYYRDKDVDKHNEYLEKSHFYFQELQKMLITSPSRVGREEPCLPYASLPCVDTGHGWRTPKGRKTGSLSSTAYFLIAYMGYNPLKAQALETSLKEFYEPDSI